MTLEAHTMSWVDTDWLRPDEGDRQPSHIDGVVPVHDFDPRGRAPEQVAIMERAEAYRAKAVFFEAPRNGKAPVAQAFIFDERDGFDDDSFARLHKRLWSWGGVPLAYLRGSGVVRLFRCAHKPDFSGADGQLVCNPIRTLRLGADIAQNEIWWDAARLRSGTIWDDPDACRLMLSAQQSAHRKLVEAVRGLADRLAERDMLEPRLRRRLLILSLLIAYLEERRVLLPTDFGEALPDATEFFQVLRQGDALVSLLQSLEQRFNGHVFRLSSEERDALQASDDLAEYARLVEGYEDIAGQLSFWKLYSFADLPVELISNIYQLFVADTSSSIYTPPALVRLMLDEALSWERLDELMAGQGVILDPACGSGVFLVEAYKRLVLHWRFRNDWARPDVDQLRSLLTRVHGVDLEEGAVELAAFSLCLSLCDALEPADIRSSVKLFPQLAGKTLHWSCFFLAKEEHILKASVSVVLGNPPFVSQLTTPGAKRSYARYGKEIGHLADKQLAYLFLHEAMDLLEEDGILAMVSPSGFLYNQNALDFRQDFFARWSVREVLDFVSIRGLFRKGEADPKVVIVLAEKCAAASKHLLHAIFRRNGRAEADQGFQVDYYDMYWLSAADAALEPDIWRCNLLGGGRVAALVRRLRAFPTLGEFARERGWNFGEGFIVGHTSEKGNADHLVGQWMLPATALTAEGIDRDALEIVPDTPFIRPRPPERYKPPLLLVKKHKDLHHAYWEDQFLAYGSEMIGFTSSDAEAGRLEETARWLEDEATALKAFVASTSPRLFTQRATAILSSDILSLPHPADGDLDLSENERIVAEDIVEFQRDFIRLGSKSSAMNRAARDDLQRFNDIFIRQISAVYPKRPLRATGAYSWSGAICQAFAFGHAEVDWSDATELRDKIDDLLTDQSTENLTVKRIVRLYDGQCLFLIKPDRIRFWLRSIALRDADDVLADLRAQGF